MNIMWALALLLNVATAQTDDAADALVELESVYSTLTLMLHEAHTDSDTRRTLALDTHHARVTVLHQVITHERERLSAALASEDDRAAADAAGAIDEALRTARRLLAEVSHDAVSVGAALERESAAHPVSRANQLTYAEGVLEELSAMMDPMHPDVEVDSLAGRWYRDQYAVLSSLSELAEESLHELALTNSQSQADHEYRKVIIACTKARQLNETIAQGYAAYKLNPQDLACPAPATERFTLWSTIEMPSGDEDLWFQGPRSPDVLSSSDWWNDDRL